ncbi:uncharacterized protein LOC132309192 [Cornus florida]|uniref:uncharacterized protein LOC132309192 n=1 Tax=Cornus florida TaxID=4283 RepID=UPI00289DC2D3|nr:uncharacterized protein LOC132309192 [Cornus florida]
MGQLSHTPSQALKKVPSCSHCLAKKFEHEPPTFCCSNGDVILTSTLVPDELYKLFTSQTDAFAKDFVDTYLYFYDTDNELQNRMNILNDSNLSEPIVAKLMNILSSNPNAQFLRRLKDIPVSDNHEIVIKNDVQLDQRVFNSPTTDQVAAVWIEGAYPDMRLERDIIVVAHSGRKHRVRHYFGCYDPLQYPLLFPYGEIGWHRNIKNRRQPYPGTDITHEDDIFDDSIMTGSREGVEGRRAKKISCRQYYCYKLQIRNQDRSILLYAGRLLQQYSVDMYIKIETTRLDYYRTEQSHIRTELYQRIVDSVVAGENRGNNVGKRVVLPSSFIGGPRDMQKRYYDAMCLVQRFGKPDLFIIMTCNPDWNEIKEELKSGQLAQDRPDLTTRVFRAKLYDLKKQLFQKLIFGKVVAHVYVIEFQKRGLPHAHMLLIFESEHKITNADHYDKFVYAEITNENENPTLYAKVVKHMMHGPCGDLNVKNACMMDGKCKNHYPRQFNEQTIQGQDCYPIYRRRKDGPTVSVRNATLDNRWVVPYNPYLLQRYDCHINVEICSGLLAIKYLYKYIYKGHDRATVYLSNTDSDDIIDEIKDYQEARWVSPHEAMWRIF